MDDLLAQIIMNSLFRFLIDIESVSVSRLSIESVLSMYRRYK